VNQCILVVTVCVCVCLQLWCTVMGTTNRRDSIQGNWCSGCCVRCGCQQADTTHSYHLSGPMAQSHGRYVSTPWPPWMACSMV